jgi:poly(3-hydroxybutyrate) depolymerase
MNNSQITTLGAVLTLATAISGGAAAPQIRATSSLQHKAVDLAQNTSFVVTAVGDAPLFYQWRRDGSDLLSQTNRTITITNARPADEGDYTVAVANASGAVASAPARLWVVPPASSFIKGNYTNSARQRLPFFYLLPANYDPARSYPLMCWLHGTPGDESVITTPNYGYLGYANYPMLKALASYRQQARDPVILFWPTRRTPDDSWTDAYLRLVSGALDQFLNQFNVDTNRVYVGGVSEGFHAAWDLMGLRPGFFAAACVAAGGQGSTRVASIKEVPFWVWCAADDDYGANGCRPVVQALRQAGARLVYTEYASGGHIDGIFLGTGTPAIVDWMLGQRRGVSGTVEPNLRINAPAETTITTGAASIDLVGVAAALGQAITQLRWTNTVNRATGIATPTNVWDVTGVPLVPDRTNVVIVTATTTSWAPAFGGNTTFNDTLTVVCKPIRATLAMQGGDTVLDWSGGAPPYSVQRTTDLGKGDWTDFLTSAMPPLMLPPEGKAGFYRVLGQ